MRTALVSIASLISLISGCKTATEKQCDALFDRYASCSGKPLERALRDEAATYCYISLGHELEPGDTTSFAAQVQRTLEECSAITACEPLLACFQKHDCVWIFANATDPTPTFSCRN
ncbi:MAG: hypothetical protein IPQ07_21115 [Myxococcales bacterium]|nr:hypothetical protein [Myxococcales bacterium]